MPQIYVLPVYGIQSSAIVYYLCRTLLSRDVHYLYGLHLVGDVH